MKPGKHPDEFFKQYIELNVDGYGRPFQPMYGWKNVEVRKKQWVVSKNNPLYR
jgi:hypothetical protein